MKIIIISNFYPPIELGGWEQLTCDIVQGLKKRGHEVLVLTSDFRKSTITQPEEGVWRKFRLESNPDHYQLKNTINHLCNEQHNKRVVSQAISAFKPGIVFVHGMWLLSSSIPWMAEKLLPDRVVYYMAGNWTYTPNAHENFWNASTRRAWLAPLKKIAGMIPRIILKKERENYRLKFFRVACVSKMIREDIFKNAHIPFERSCVIYNAVDVDEFAPSKNWNPGVWKNTYPKFIYAGSLLPNKGVHVVVQGFAKALDYGLKDATLTIVGSGSASYETNLKQLITQLGIEKKVDARGWMSRSQLPQLLREHDIMLFGTINFEALSRIIQEGMSCGLLLIGTTVGGCGELLEEGRTGLTYSPGNPDELALQIIKAVNDPDLRSKITSNARQVIVEKFSMKRMMDEVETFLFSTL